MISMRSAVVLTALFLFAGLLPARALEPIKGDPFAGAIVVDAASGDVLFARNANRQVYPASVLKLMDLLIVLDEIHAGRLTAQTPVVTSAHASRMGGSQVYLKEGEIFPVEDLMYALMIQSANDAAVALAEHIAGTKEAFVERMNRKARELGMTETEFHSVHGLPPGQGQKPDVTTARDIAILAREAVRHPEILAITSTPERGFRNDTFIMRTHNALLGDVQGCDGLKTGYYRAAGFSIAATAERNGRRIIAVVMGSESKDARNRACRDLLEKGFLALGP